MRLVNTGTRVEYYTHRRSVHFDEGFGERGENNAQAIRVVARALYVAWQPTYLYLDTTFVETMGDRVAVCKRLLMHI